MKENIIDGVTPICTPKEEVKVEHEFVDLGLPSGRLWATCNIGSEKPTDYGDYFLSGALEPYNINDYGTLSDDIDVVNLFEMDDEHDAAKALWGDDWRMPTLTDFAELIDNCKYVMEVIDGITCGVFTSKINNQKIVMPASGVMSLGGPDNIDCHGYYWCRSFNSSTYAWILSFYPGGRYICTYDRNSWISVRPVRS